MNILFSEADIDSLALHQCGNSGREEGMKISGSLLAMDDADLRFTLLDFFLSSFNTDTFYRFDHPSDLSMNEIHAYCQRVMQNNDDLYEVSTLILKHLYDKSSHPAIQAGDVYIALMRNILIEDELVDAIGIFKSEKKDTFLKVVPDGDDAFRLETQQGANIGKLDKGALILLTEPEDGLRVLCVDLKSTDAQYWKDDFLGITQLQDSAFHTKTYMNMVKDFVKEVVAKETTKQEQIQFLNKTIDYFDKHETFDVNEFEDRVLGEDTGKKQQFTAYRKAYLEDNGIEPEKEPDGFFIENRTVRNLKRKLKGMIKLDTQIEIRFTTPDENVNEEFVERGYDEEKQMNYYKIFFNKES